MNRRSRAILAEIFANASDGLELTGIAIVAAAVLAFVLVSRSSENTPVTLPIVFAGFGWLIGAGGLNLAPIDPGHGAIHTIAELTLILVLFSDAARIG